MAAYLAAPRPGPVAAACFRARFVGRPTPAGERTVRVPAGYRRTAGSRGRGETRPFGAADLAAVHATSRAGATAAARPRRSPASAAAFDAVIAGLLFMAGMRRSDHIRAEIHGKGLVGAAKAPRRSAPPDGTRPRDPSPRGRRELEREPDVDIGKGAAPGPPRGSERDNGAALSTIEFYVGVVDALVDDVDGTVSGGETMH